MRRRRVTNWQRLRRATAATRATSAGPSTLALGTRAVAAICATLSERRTWGSALETASLARSRLRGVVSFAIWLATDCGNIRSAARDVRDPLRRAFAVLLRRDAPQRRVGVGARGPPSRRVDCASLSCASSSASTSRLAPASGVLARTAYSAATDFDTSRRPERRVRSPRAFAPSRDQAFLQRGIERRDRLIDAVRRRIAGQRVPASCRRRPLCAVSSRLSVSPTSLASSASSTCLQRRAPTFLPASRRGERAAARALSGAREQTRERDLSSLFVESRVVTRRIVRGDRRRRSRSPAIPFVIWSLPAWRVCSTPQRVRAEARP